MARIVITSWGSHGDVNPYIALARTLAERGHQPVIATSSYYRGAVEAEGIAFHPVRPDVDAGDAETIRRIMDANRGSEVVIREIMMPSLEQSYADLGEALRGADLLVSHPVSFAAPIHAALSGIPWVSTVLAPMSFFSRHDLPVFAPAPWLKRAERLGGWASSALVRAVRLAAASWGEPVYRMRARLGLPKGGDPVFEGQHSPRMVLALFSRLLAEPQPDWPANVRVTGHLFYDAAHGSGLSSELERFLECGSAPLVFTLGTSAVLAAGDFYEESAAAARRIGRRAVLLAGDRAANLGGSNDDLLALPAAPHSALFPRAAAVVQQCGIGTLGQAMRAGRPTLCVPFAHDQPDNAHRLTRLGSARTVYPKQYRAPHVADELRRLLDDPSYARRAAEVAAVVRTERGAEAACDAIEEVLASSRRSVGTS